MAFEAAFRQHLAATMNKLLKSIHIQ